MSDSVLGDCEVYTKRKASTLSNKALVQTVGSGSLIKRIAIAILRELPETDNGNTYIVVVADCFTKWTKCFAIPNLESKTVDTKIVEEVITRLGFPYTILSDQGQ